MRDQVRVRVTVWGKIELMASERPLEGCQQGLQSVQIISSNMIFSVRGRLQGDARCMHEPPPIVGPPLPKAAATKAVASTKA